MLNGDALLLHKHGACGGAVPGMSRSTHCLVSDHVCRDCRKQSDAILGGCCLLMPCFMPGACRVYISSLPLLSVRVWRFIRPPLFLLAESLCRLCQMSPICQSCRRISFDGQEFQLSGGSDCLYTG